MSKYYKKHRNVRTLNLLMGPALFLLCLVMLPHSVFTTAASRGAVGTVVWMAYWWVSGPIDFAITGHDRPGCGQHSVPAVFLREG